MIFHISTASSTVGRCFCPDLCLTGLMGTSIKTRSFSQILVWPVQVIHMSLNRTGFLFIYFLLFSHNFVCIQITIMSNRNHIFLQVQSVINCLWGTQPVTPQPWVGNGLNCYTEATLVICSKIRVGVLPGNQNWFTHDFFTSHSCVREI